MTAPRLVLCVAIAAAVLVDSAHARAVNISNTWMLPEEGFPVFYRYFRDRISWYEADAVCQFHHGNLVTVDTTSQFDAVRAYLKELDIITNVWIGLTKPGDKTEFAWSSSQPLSGEGYWGEAPPSTEVAICAATDPAADFRWHALTCGGPEIASFICELPVPPWASGADGCMLTSLPSLTVIYLPEQTAVELTSDCGLDGTKRIACKGNADHEEMMRQLSCGITQDDFDEKSNSKSPSQSTIFDITSTKSYTKTAATKPWIWTSNTVDTGEYGSPTRHRRETEDTFSTMGGITTTESKHTTILRSDTKHNVYPTTKSNFVTTGSSLPETTHQRPVDKSLEMVTTTRPVRIYQKHEGSTSFLGDQQTNTATSEPSEAGEYQSINQGQLFSIIENGTLFDIIEVNETSTDLDDKSGKTTLKPVYINTYITTRLTSSQASSGEPEKSPVTTVSYYKEIPSKVEGRSTQVSPNKLEKTGKDLSLVRHTKTVNDLGDVIEEKTFMKAIEAYPSEGASLIKLNRTNRKELPLVDFNATEETKISERPEEIQTKQNVAGFKEIDKDYTITHIHEHKIVEITITDVDRKKDATKLYVTTKRYDKSKKKYDKPDKVANDDNNKNTNDFGPDKTSADETQKGNFTGDININIEISEVPNNTSDSNGTLDETLQITIDSRADEPGKNASKKQREDITDLLVTNVNGKINKSTKEKQSDDHGADTKDADKEMSKTTEEPIEPVPEIQPRPNRNRILTRPQRRSFYPYFFSRVLG